MAEYKINALDEAPAKPWNGPQGTIYYKNVGLEGHDKPVSIGKKTPNALKVGDTVYGDIIPTDYLTDKWKHGEPPDAPRASQSSSNGSSTQNDHKYLKDVTDIPMRFMQSLLQYYDVQKLESNPTMYNNYIETVKLLTEEALGMIENIRGGTVGDRPFKEEKALSKESTPAAVKYQFNKDTASEFSEEDIPEFNE